MVIPLTFQLRPKLSKIDGSYVNVVILYLILSYATLSWGSSDYYRLNVLIVFLIS